MVKILYHLSKRVNTMMSDSASSPFDTSSPSSSSSTLATTPNLTHDLRRSSYFSTACNNPYPTKATGVSLSCSCLVNASVTVVPNYDDDKQPPNYVYVFGGFNLYTDEVYNDLYRLNVSEMKWEDVIYLKGSRPSKRTNHSASLWNQDKIIIFGGTDEQDQNCNDVVILDLKTMTWERPEVDGHVPLGRARHSASIYNDKLYIVGGYYTNSEEERNSVSPDVNCLNLQTWTWEEPITLIPRHSHDSFIYQNRLYVYGGYNEEMDREKSLVILDLQTQQVSKIEITSDSGPEMNGQHFAQIYWNRLVVVVTQSLKVEAQEGSIGVWALDLDSFQWHQIEDGDRFVQGNWHYFAMAENCPRFFLFGIDEKESDEYFSNVLSIDLQEYGMSRIPPPTIGLDFAQLLNDSTTSDFTIKSNEDGPVIHVHRIILLARWPHFGNMINSGMTESFNSTLTIPEPYAIVQAFVYYLYTDIIERQLPIYTVADLMVLGNMYLIPRLTSLCCALLQENISIGNVAKIYHCASVAGAHALKKRSMRYINTNFGPVSKTQGFRSLPKEILFDFLDSLPEKAKISVE